MKQFTRLLTVILFSVMAGAGASAMDLSFMTGFAPVLGLNILAPVIMPAMTGVLNQLVFTAPGGAGVAFTFNQTQLPQFLIWNDTVALTSLRVETAEDGIILDLPAAGIAAINGFGQVGAMAAGTAIIRLGNGVIKNRNVTISGVTSGAGAVPFYVSWDQPGNAIFKYSLATIIANNRQEFKDFTAVFVPALAATETCEVQFRTGEIATFDPFELSALSAMYNDAAGVILNNMNAYIHRAIFTTGANRAAYIMSVKKLAA